MRAFASWRVRRLWYGAFAWIDPVTHQVQQTIYLAKRNPKPADKTDLFEIISAATPEQAIDTASLTACKLKPYADIPTYEQ